MAAVVDDFNVVAFLEQHDDVASTKEKVAHLIATADGLPYAE